MGQGDKDDDKNHASAHAGNARLASKFVEVVQRLRSQLTPKEVTYVEALVKSVTDGVNASIEAVAQGAHVGSLHSCRCCFGASWPC